MTENHGYPQPEKAPIIETSLDGGFVQPTETDLALREYFPELSISYRNTPKKRYPRIVNPQAHRDYLRMIRVINRRVKGTDPSDVVELEAKLRVKYGRHFGAENFAIVGRWLRHEPLEELIERRKTLIRDFERFVSGEELDGMATLERPFKPGEADHTLSMFWYNLADFYGYAGDAALGLEAMKKSIAHFSLFASAEYPGKKTSMSEGDLIMLISRLVMRASFLDALGEMDACNAALQEAQQINSSIYKEVLTRLANQAHLEMFIDRIR